MEKTKFIAAEISAEVTEGKIVQYIIKKAKEAGGTTRKIAYEGSAGAPDRLVLLPGRAFFVEAKHEKGGRLSPAQEREIKILQDAGMTVYVCASKQEVDDAFCWECMNSAIFKIKNMPNL